MDLEGQRLRPLTEEGGCHPGGRESCPECPGHWSRATGGHHWVKGLQEGAGMPAPEPSYEAQKTGMEACGCRLGMEEQACQALLASGNRPLPFQLLLSPWTDGLFLEA